jgi:adenine-specific DNA methylase
LKVEQPKLEEEKIEVIVVDLPYSEQENITQLAQKIVEMSA